MNRVILHSSTILSVGYDQFHGILEVEFINGSLYQYYGVPDYIFNEFIKADSPGTFFDLYVKKTGYEYLQVEEGFY